jgi:hypothetical protein
MISGFCAKATTRKIPRPVRTKDAAAPAEPLGATYGKFSLNRSLGDLAGIVPMRCFSDNGLPPVRAE